MCALRFYFLVDCPNFVSGTRQLPPVKQVADETGTVGAGLNLSPATVDEECALPSLCLWMNGGTWPGWYLSYYLLQAVQVWAGHGQVALWVLASVTYPQVGRETPARPSAAAASSSTILGENTDLCSSRCTAEVSCRVEAFFVQFRCPCPVPPPRLQNVAHF